MAIIEGCSELPRIVELAAARTPTRRLVLWNSPPAMWKFAEIRVNPNIDLPTRDAQFLDTSILYGAKQPPI